MGAFDRTAIGIDVGGTKTAAALVEVATGRVVERRQVATRPERGGAAVLADCAALARQLADGVQPVGIGFCELVDLDGVPASADTVDWRGLDVAAAFAAPRVVIESDVRAAARAEARFGAGAGSAAFLHVVVGTGASVCLVVGGAPYAGAHGHAIVLGAPPVEAVASGRALERQSGLAGAAEVLADARHAPLVTRAASALAETLAVLANALDPGLIVLGGGLGSDAGFCGRVADALHPLLAYPDERPLAVVPSQLARDGGVVGAALSAVAGAGL